MILSPLPWVPEMQVPAENVYPPLHCPTQLAQSLLAYQLRHLHWYMAWNGITPI